MKTRSIWALLLTLGLFAGCGPKPTEVTVKGADGSTVTSKSDNSGNVTMEGKGPQGNSTFSSFNGNVTASTTDTKGNTSTASVGSNVDISQLGVKLYPGASVKEGSSVHADTPQETSTGLVLQTADDAAKVMDFYKSELKAENTLTTPTGGMMSGTISTGAKAVIVFTKEDKGCSVSITTVKKK